MAIKELKQIWNYAVAGIVAVVILEQRQRKFYRILRSTVS